MELRIYEAGKAVRRYPLTHGEAWAADSTRVIPLTLNEALDPRNVLRFSLYYRAASPLSPPWQVVAADVDLSAGHEPPQLLLDTTLSGEIARQGELATLDRDASTISCMSDYGLRRFQDLQRQGAVRTAHARCRCAWLRERPPGGLSGQPGLHRGAGLRRCRLPDPETGELRLEHELVRGRPGRSGVGRPCAQASNPAR